MKRLLFLILLVSVLGLIGCEGKPTFTEKLTLAGVTYEPETLNRGKENYILYCRACHGENGDGNGPAAKGLYPHPRDFRIGTIKYASVKAGGLAPDKDFHRVVLNGLNGTAMLPWDISQERLDTITAYIKTFSPEGKVWRAKDAKIGEDIVVSKDPFEGKDPNPEAIEMGKLLYHGIAACISCHPAYATKEYIHLSGKTGPTKYGLKDFRNGLFEPQLTASKEFGFKILPRDFTYHKIAAGTYDKKTRIHKATKEDLFRTLAAGIGGAMPVWQGSVPDEFIWAVVHYVKYLTEMNDAERAKLRVVLDEDEKKTFAIPSKEVEAKFAQEKKAEQAKITEYFTAFMKEMDADDDDDDDDDKK